MEARSERTLKVLFSFLAAIHSDAWNEVLSCPWGIIIAKAQKAAKNAKDKPLFLIVLPNTRSS